MLDNLSRKINEELQAEESREFFYDFIHEDVEFENFIDNKLLRLNENGVNDKMLKNEMPFLFIEDTVVDDELVTRLQAEVDYEDNFEKKPIADTDETTDLQEPVDYDDDFSFEYASDADADTNLFKEVDYDDHQTTPVNIDEFSNEAVDLLFEMGDIMGALELMEAEECDGTNLEVNCPDEDDDIEQAEEADVEDTEYPDMPEGVVMEDLFSLFEDEDLEIEDDEEVVEEDFFSLFESSDEDEDDSDDEDEDDEDDSDDEDEDDSDDEDEDDEDDSDDEDEALEEAFDFFNFF